MDTRRVQEYNLSLVAGIDRQDTVSCGLVLIGCDGEFLADQLVHQGGLSHVRPAKQSGKTGFTIDIFHIHSPFYVRRTQRRPPVIS